MRWILVLLGLLTIAAGCGGSDERQASSGDLVTVGSVEQIAEAFDDAAGQPRLVLLLSPT